MREECFKLESKCDINNVEIGDVFRIARGVASYKDITVLVINKGRHLNYVLLNVAKDNNNESILNFANNYYMPSFESATLVDENGFLDVAKFRVGNIGDNKLLKVLEGYSKSQYEFYGINK